MKTTGNAVTKVIAAVLALACVLTFVPFNASAEDVVSAVGLINSTRILTADELKANDASPLAGSYRKELSQGVQNILLRARQMYEITWTPLADVKADSFTCPGTFVKGQTYQGVPYGQPVHEGRYVGSNATIDEFAAATKDINSKMYTTKGENTYNYTQQVGNKQIRYCPYYATDCSGFVSYAWGIKRMTTSSFSSKKTKDGSSGYKDLGKDINLLEPGHAICTDGSGHIILIYDVEYDASGKLLRVTTLEQVEPQMRKKVWGVGGNAGTLEDLQSFMNGTLKSGAKPYSIIEYMDADNVTVTPVTSSPIGSETSINKIELPASFGAENTAATGVATLSSSDSVFKIKGWALNKTAITGFEYKIDNGLWHTLTAGYDSSVFEVENSHFKGISDINTFNGTAMVPSVGNHTLTVRAELKNGTKYEVAKVTLQVVSSGANIPFNICLDTFKIAGKSYGGSGSSQINRVVDISSVSDAKIVADGWCVAKGGIKTFEYSVDGGVWKPAIQNYRQDVYNATQGSYGADCRDLNSFNCGFDLSYLKDNASHLLEFRVVTDNGDTQNLITVTLNVGKVKADENSVQDFCGDITDKGNNSFSDSAVVTVSKADASDKAVEALKNEIKDADYTIAEIKVTDGGKTVELKDKVSVGVTLPTGYKSKNTVVYTIDADGNVSKIDSKCADEKVTFDLTKLGLFAIVNEEPAQAETPTAKPSDKNDNNDTSDTDNDANNGSASDNNGNSPSSTAPSDNDSVNDQGEEGSAKDEDSNLGLIIGCIAGGIVVLSAAAVVVIILLKKKKSKSV